MRLCTRSTPPHSSALRPRRGTGEAEVEAELLAQFDAQASLAASAMAHRSRKGGKGGKKGRRAGGGRKRGGGGGGGGASTGKEDDGDACDDGADEKGDGDSAAMPEEGRASTSVAGGADYRRKCAIFVRSEERRILRNQLDMVTDALAGLPLDDDSESGGALAEPAAARTER